MEWKPIETAPLKTPILTFSEIEKDQEWKGVDVSIIYNLKKFICSGATHWMPLPETPE